MTKLLVQRIIYLVTRFSPLVGAVQFVNVYTGGGGMIVEIDVLLPKDTSLPRAHDICECIQYSIENLEGIHRACELSTRLASETGFPKRLLFKTYTRTTSTQRGLLSRKHEADKLPVPKIRLVTKLVN